MKKESKKQMYNIGEVTHILDLQLGKNQLYAFLKEEQVIDKNNCPCQEYINRGLFDKYVKIQRWNGRAYTVALVSDEGLEFIKQLVLTKKISEFPTS